MIIMTKTNSNTGRGSGRGRGGVQVRSSERLKPDMAMSESEEFAKVEVGGDCNVIELGQFEVLAGETGDLSKFEGTPFELASLKFQQSMTATLKQLVQSNVEVLERLVKSEEVVKVLQDRVVRQDETIRSLNSRVSELEQYSRRNTMILTGLPEVEHEVLEDRVCEVINAVDVLGGEINGDYIGNVHRNRPRNDGKPASITVQFVKGLHKDRLFQNKRLFRLKHGKKLNIFHAMSAGVSSEMKKIRERGGDMIEYLDYYGHSKNFVVRLKGMERMVRNVKSFCDLEDKVGQLSSLKV